jgi:hypothetical protein
MDCFKFCCSCNQGLHVGFCDSRLPQKREVELMCYLYIDARSITGAGNFRTTWSVVSSFKRRLHLSVYVRWYKIKEFPVTVQLIEYFRYVCCCPTIIPTWPMEYRDTTAIQDSVSFKMMRAREFFLSATSLYSVTVVPMSSRLRHTPIDSCRLYGKCTYANRSLTQFRSAAAQLPGHNYIYDQLQKHVSFFISQALLTVSPWTWQIISMAMKDECWQTGHEITL